MTLRSFMRAGVLFIVLLAPRPSHADPIILDGLITKTGEFREASVQFSGDNFSFTGIITPFASFASSPCSTGSWFFCSPGSTIRLGGNANASDVLGTVTIGTESFRASSGDSGTGFLDLVFAGSAVLPPVVEPTGLVSAPFSLAGRWFFPQLPPRPSVDFSGSGIVTAFLAPSVVVQGGWRITNVEYRFGSDLEPIPEPGTLLLMATGLAALARRQFARRSWRTESR